MTTLQESHRLVHQHLRRLRDGHEFTSNNDVLLLSWLWAHGATGPTELAAALGLTAGGVTTVLGRLEERGLIQREASSNDRRRQSVELSALGHAVLER